MQKAAREAIVLCADSDISRWRLADIADFVVERAY